MKKTSIEQLLKDCPFEAWQLIQAKEILQWLTEGQAMSLDKQSFLERIEDTLFNLAYETYITINGESLKCDNSMFYFERFATEEEKQKLLDAIKDNRYKWNEDNYELVPNKFDITTLKPFDKVLVRLTNNCVWMPKFFWYYDTDPNVKYYPFVIIDNIGYPQCIPYNGNEHLCRKTGDCDEFYKTWE